MITLSGYQQKKVAVFGLGRAGMSTVKSLQASGAHVLAWDDNDKARQALEEMALEYVEIAKPETYAWSELDALLLSPGVPLTHPEPHPIVKLASGHCPIICDIELLYQGNHQNHFIGITGTNGKSTTTVLIGHILRHADKPVEIGGNLGIPALDLHNIERGHYVLEMSSYQLDLLEKMHFNIAVWLNISPDHLERHGGMEGYIKAKTHIFDRQTEEDCVVIGVDDAHSNAVFEQLKTQAQQVVPISNSQKLAGGVAVIDGVIYNDIEGQASQIPLGKLKYLCGDHNAQNIAAAFAVAKKTGMEDGTIVEAIQSFKGLRHRMQYVAEMNGVTYVNDSKATNAEAASKALISYDNIYWIVGGMAKEGGIESLKPYMKQVKHAYLIGASQDEFAQTLDGVVNYSKCDTLENAFHQAKKMAIASQERSVVLLSPACASFDQWPSFEARGDAFCAMVEAKVDAA